MKLLKIKNTNVINLNYLDTKFFELGIFFLASAPFITCLLFLFPLFKGFLEVKNNILKDSFNQLLISISIILIFKSIASSFFNNTDIPLWNSSLNWVGISNLIPLFICYLVLNPYLDNEYKRKRIAKLFVAGTIPVLVSCVGQYWFNWHGPFEVFNGLIKWFQRPLDYTDYAVSGLFNNQNYTAAWLTMIWPFILTLLKDKLNLKEINKSRILFVISIFNAIFVILTKSRNGYIGLLIPLIFLFGRRSMRWLFLFICSLILFLIVSNLFFSFSDISEISRFFIPGNFVNRFNAIDLDSRIKIWFQAISFISQKPFFGWGANSFAYLYEIKTGILIFHAHNLFLELSISFGLIVACVLFFVIVNVLIKSFKSIFIRKNTSLIDKGWWISGFIFFLSHLFDVLIFDIRINLASWVIFVGLRNTFSCKDKFLNEKSNNFIN